MSEKKDNKEKLRWKRDERTSEEKITSLFESFESALNEVKEREGLAFGLEVDKDNGTILVDLVPEDKKDVVSGDIKLSVPTSLKVGITEGIDKKYGLEFFDIIGSNSKVSIAKVYKDRVNHKTKKATKKVLERVIPFVRSNAAAVREELNKLQPALEKVSESSDASQALNFIPDTQFLNGRTIINGFGVTRFYNVREEAFTRLAISGPLDAETIKAIEALL